MIASPCPAVFLSASSTINVIFLLAALGKIATWFKVESPAMEVLNITELLSALLGVGMAGTWLCAAVATSTAIAAAKYKRCI
jgi:hypothetical protein